MSIIIETLMLKLLEALGETIGIFLVFLTRSRRRQSLRTDTLFVRVVSSPARPTLAIFVVWPVSGTLVDESEKYT